jgi:Na+-transporting NADH:ubiquinone oxidoreductase subunit NqrB
MKIDRLWQIGAGVLLLFLGGVSVLALCLGAGFLLLMGLEQAWNNVTGLHAVVLVVFSLMLIMAGGGGLYVVTPMVRGLYDALKDATQRNS